MEPFIPGIEVRVASKKDLWQVLELANRIFPATYREICSRTDRLYDAYDVS